MAHGELLFAIRSLFLREFTPKSPRRPIDPEAIILQHFEVVLIKTLKQFEHEGFKIKADWILTVFVYPCRYDELFFCETINELNVSQSELSSLSWNLWQKYCWYLLFLGFVLQASFNFKDVFLRMLNFENKFWFVWKYLCFKTRFNTIKDKHVLCLSPFQREYQEYDSKSKHSNEPCKAMLANISRRYTSSVHKMLVNFLNFCISNWNKMITVPLIFECSKQLQWSYHMCSASSRELYLLL